MTNPIDVLMDEHRLIEQVLGSLETCLVEVGAGLSPERPLVADYVAFLAGFADTRHHGKEEDILFQRMAERGFPGNGGPIGVMLMEHDQGRSHVRALRTVGEGSGPVGASELQVVRAHAGAFIPLLRQHILKEDQVLYPMALRVLDDADLAEMAEAFDAFDRQGRADGTFDRQQALAERLLYAFRPDPARMAAAAGMGHCGR